MIRESLSNQISEYIVHTGQHFDENMSGIFFQQMDVPEPSYQLGIAGVGHGAMTGRMLEQLESLFKKRSQT